MIRSTLPEIMQVILDGQNDRSDNRNRLNDNADSVSLILPESNLLHETRVKF